MTVPCSLSTTRAAATSAAPATTPAQTSAASTGQDSPPSCDVRNKANKPAKSICQTHSDYKKRCIFRPTATFASGQCLPRTSGGAEPDAASMTFASFFCDVRNKRGNPARTRCTQVTQYTRRCAFLRTDLYPAGQCVPHPAPAATAAATSFNCAVYNKQGNPAKSVCANVSPYKERCMLQKGHCVPRPTTASPSTVQATPVGTHPACNGSVWQGFYSASFRTKGGAVGAVQARASNATQCADLCYASKLCAGFSFGQSGGVYVAGAEDCILHSGAGAADENLDFNNQFVFYRRRQGGCAPAVTATPGSSEAPASTKAAAETPPTTAATSRVSASGPAQESDGLLCDVRNLAGNPAKNKCAKLQSTGSTLRCAWQRTAAFPRGQCVPLIVGSTTAAAATVPLEPTTNGAGDHQNTAATATLVMATTASTGGHQSTAATAAATAAEFSVPATTNSADSVRRKCNDLMALFIKYTDASSRKNTCNDLPGCSWNKNTKLCTGVPASFAAATSTTTTKQLKKSVYCFKMTKQAKCEGLPHCYWDPSAASDTTREGRCYRKVYSPLDSSTLQYTPTCVGCS